MERRRKGKRVVEGKGRAVEDVEGTEEEGRAIDDGGL